MMPRRDFLSAAPLLMAGAPQAAGSAGPSAYELRLIEMRNSSDDELRHTQEFLGTALAPAFHSAGVTTVSAFRVSIGPGSPTAVLLSEYPSFGALAGAAQKVEGDASYRAAYEKYVSSTGRVYERESVWLLEGFPGFPTLKAPKRLEKGSHILELRRYESPNMVTLERKIRMFDTAEAAIFERLGMQPVFFGRMVAGDRMPNLMYMLAFENLAARERLWRSFGSDPEWKKLSARPELHDSEIVSNISNWILDPMPFSDVR